MEKMPQHQAMIRFMIVFTIVPVLWLWWLSYIPNSPLLTIDKTWNYNISDWETAGATTILIVMIGWVFQLLFTMKAGSERLSIIIAAGLFFHTVPAMCLLAAVLKAKIAQDTQFVWFSTLMAFRYWRTLVSIFFWTQYKISEKHTKGKPECYQPVDCTVVVATVGPENNVELFTRMVEAILTNQPKRVVFSTPKPSIADIVRPIVIEIQKKFEASKRQTNTVFEAEIVVTGEANKQDKRTQVVQGFKAADTPIIIMADDSAVWGPKFVETTLPAFQNEKVGFVGTRKWVERLPLPEHDPKISQYQNFAAKYHVGLWNTIGALYLVRHNFEIRASNAADGGVFCVSGRTSLILSKIVKDENFINQFLNEYIWAFPRLGVEGVGPLKADDDNFITRWVINHGMDVKIQYSKDATMTTQLGRIDHFKFIQQCIRWSRTTMRQNPTALFVDQTIWWKWPISVWIVYFPWLYNAALFWDALAVWSFTTTGFFRESPVQYRWLGLLILVIWMSKLTKTMAWFLHRENWPDFFWYFFPIPAYPLFVYGHSLLKIYTVATVWINDWGGRAQAKGQQESEGKMSS